MSGTEYQKKLEDKIFLLESRTKHLEDELKMAKEEYKRVIRSYNDLMSGLEEKVDLRTKELNKLKHILEIKGRELQIMVDSSPTMICYKDKYQRYIRVNKHFAKFFGRPIKEILGKTHSELFAHQPCDILENDMDVFEGGEAILNQAADIETELGPKSISINKIPYKSKDGNVNNVITFIQDLTELKRIEKEKTELQKRITRSEKMEAIGLLAGGFAHDCNNLLGGMIGYIELAQMKMGYDEDTIRLLTASLDSAERLAQMVQDLLTLARRDVVKTKGTNLNDVIMSFMRSSTYKRLKDQYSDISINLDLDPDLMNIIGTQSHLDKTILNLISNAAVALPQGGNISISTRNRYVDKPFHGYDCTINEGEYVVFSVEDDGTGIASGDMNRIFEPFYTTKVMGKNGSGLGMAVVYGTVQDHDGYINIRSGDNIGTIFELFFPISREAALPQKSVKPMNSYMGSGQKVLIVDDVRTQREIASDILSHLGYSVSAVASGEEAIEYVKHHSADILVLDMIMSPGIDGLDTYRKILEIRPGQKVIIASGFSESNRVKECERLGAGQYIHKPFTFEDIGMAVKKELNCSIAAVN